MFHHFHRLWDDLSLIRERAGAIESPNSEDDDPVRCAIVGYCYHQPISAWSQTEFEFVAAPRQEVADYGPRWVEFVCLASGYLLGIYQAGLCSDREFREFEAQLPGFMWLHSNRFTTGQP